MPNNQFSTTGSVTYNNIVTDKHHFYVKSDEAIIHRLNTKDFYRITYDVDSMLSETLNRMATDRMSLDFKYLSDVAKIHCIEKNKTTMM